MLTSEVSPRTDGVNRLGLITRLLLLFIYILRDIYIRDRYHTVTIVTPAFKAFSDICAASVSYTYDTVNIDYNGGLNYANFIQISHFGKKDKITIVCRPTDRCVIGYIGKVYIHEVLFLRFRKNNYCAKNTIILHTYGKRRVRCRVCTATDNNRLSL